MVYFILRLQDQASSNSWEAEGETQQQQVTYAFPDSPMPPEVCQERLETYWMHPYWTQNPAPTITPARQGAMTGPCPSHSAGGSDGGAGSKLHTSERIHS